MEGFLTYEEAMSENAGYPGTPVVFSNPDAHYKPEEFKAVKEFRVKRRSPEDFKELLGKLNEVHGKNVELFVHEFVMDGYNPVFNRINLNAKAKDGETKSSLISFLHEFGHALGYNEWKAVAWSITLFALVYPRAFARLKTEKHMLVQSRE